jgi:hypothetical protein
MLHVAFGEQTMEKTRVFEWFSMFKSSVTSDVDDKCSRHPLISKTDENSDRVKELVLENRGPLPVKLLTCWKFHLGQFRAF